MSLMRWRAYSQLREPYAGLLPVATFIEPYAPSNRAHMPTFRWHSASCRVDQTAEYFSGWVISSFGSQRHRSASYDNPAPIAFAALQKHQLRQLDSPHRPQRAVAGTGGDEPGSRSVVLQPPDEDAG